MELALPILTLGGLYILSNKDEENTEGFESKRFYQGERGSTIQYNNNDEQNQIVNPKFPQEDTVNDEYTSKQTILDSFRKRKK